MPSAFGDFAPALALVPAFHARGVPRRLWVLGALCAAAPDLDVAAFLPFRSIQVSPLSGSRI